MTLAKKEGWPTSGLLVLTDELVRYRPSAFRTRAFSGWSCVRRRGHPWRSLATLPGGHFVIGPVYAAIARPIASRSPCCRSNLSCADSAGISLAPFDGSRFCSPSQWLDKVRDDNNLVTNGFA